MIQGVVRSLVAAFTLFLLSGWAPVQALAEGSGGPWEDPEKVSTLLDSVSDILDNEERDAMPYKVAAELFGHNALGMNCTPNFPSALFDFVYGGHLIVKRAHETAVTGVDFKKGVYLNDALYKFGWGMLNVFKCVVENPTHPVSKAVFEFAARFGLDVTEQFKGSEYLLKPFEVLGKGVRVGKAVIRLHDGLFALVTVARNNETDWIVVSDKMLTGIINTGIGISDVLDVAGVKAANIPGLVFRIAEKVRELDPYLPVVAPLLYKRYSEKAMFESCRDSGPDYYRWMKVGAQSGFLPRVLDQNIRECLAVVAKRYPRLRENDRRAQDVLPFTTMLYCEKFSFDGSAACAQLRPMMQTLRLSGK